MPKGYNKDGSKKVRPVGSGRKPKESKAISPQISLEAFAVLAGLKKQKINLNDFISKAILEKAANDAAKKAALKKDENEPGKPGQVHLVDMLAEIKLESQQTLKVEKPTKVKRTRGNGYLINLIPEDQSELPEWLRSEPVDKLPEPELTPEPVFSEYTSTLSKPANQEERRKVAYAGMLERIFTANLKTISIEDALAKIMRIRRKGKVDAIEVLTECHNLALCTNNGISIGLNY